MIEIIVKDPNDPGSFDKALRTFKKLIDKEGFLQELRERRYFLSTRDRVRLKRKARRMARHK